MISQYIVLNETKKSLMVLRAYQYYAVEAILESVSNKSNGYVWHTTGSGKTLTSFKACQILTSREDTDKVMFIVDRNDLDYQTTKEFNSFSAGAVDGTDNTNALIKQLKGKNKLIITTIQKLHRAVKGRAKQLENYRNLRMILMFDECHRSQFGDMHKDITNFFTNINYYGFTGTPIFAENANKSRTTEDLFGKRLHSYLIKDAIHDENVLGFAVDYVGTYKSRVKTDIEVEAIDIDASKKAAEAAIAAYNKLGDAARTQDANISKLATALAEYYQDALDKELKSTKAEATETSTNTKKAISAWIIANPLANFKSIVGLELNLIEWTAGAVTKANKIEQANANKLLELGASAGDIPYESWKKASTKVFGDKFNRDNEPRRVAVSADMVLKEVNGNRLATELQDGDYGTLGISIYATAEAARLTAVINQADTYKALKAEFTAQKAKEQATLDKKKTELAANVAKAETALTDAKAAYDKVFKEVEANIKKVSEDYDYKDAIKDKIESTISDYIASLDELGDDYKDMTLEEIKEAINAEYLKAVTSLLDKKAALATAERNLEKLAEGTYTDNNYIEDTFANIQENIKVKQAEYDAAKADYDTASAQLKALLAIFLK